MPIRPRQRLRKRLLAFEALEFRRLLATYDVNTVIDSVDDDLLDGVAEDSLGRTSLRAAIMQSNANIGIESDTINLPAGNYALTLTSGSTDDAFGDLDINKGGFRRLTIQGAGALTTIIDATAVNERVLQVYSLSSLSLIGVTLTGGAAAGNGGGILSEGGTSLAQIDIHNNVAARGGGIYFSDYLVVNQSTIHDNTATIAGGGIYVGSGSEYLNVDNSTISSNSTSGDGAGIFAENIFPEEGGMQILHTTVTRNQATGNGGGIVSAFDGEAGAAAIQLYASIVANNTAVANADLQGVFGSSGASNVIGKAVATNGFVDGINNNRVGSVLLPVDPGLTSLQLLPGDNTPVHLPIASSPAVDRVPNPIPLIVDQRNRSRVVDGNLDGVANSDSGAVEFSGLVIRGVVFHDLDCDGIRDEGEEGINGWQVFIDQNANGTLDALEPQTKTNATGNYEFTGLNAGNYRIAQEQRAHFSTKALFHEVTVKLNTIVDFDDFRLGEIHSYKFLDVNGDGIDNNADPRLANIPFQLRSPGPDTIFDNLDDVVRNTATNANGEFSFVDLPKGTYRLTETVPPHKVVTTLPIGDFEFKLSGTLFVPTATFREPDPYQTRTVRAALAVGNFRLGEIRGFKWGDLGGDGKDTNDPRLPNIEFRLYGAGPNGVYDTLFTSTTPVGDDSVRLTTSAITTGAFGFADLPKGKYTLIEILPADRVPKTDPTPEFIIDKSGMLFVPTLGFGGAPDTYQNPIKIDQLAVGNAHLGIIRGRVYLESGAAVLYQEGERGLSTFEVKLSQNGVVLKTLATDCDGNYEFKDLMAGNYTVTVTLKEHYVNNVKNVVTTPLSITFDVKCNDIFVSDSARQPPKDPDQTYKPLNGLAFGLQRLAGIYGDAYSDLNTNEALTANGMRDPGELIFDDLNRNNSQDAGEFSHAGQTVQLLKIDDTVVPATKTLTQTTIVLASGVYVFENVEAGKYLIRILLPTENVNGVLQDKRGRTSITFEGDIGRNNVYADLASADPRKDFEVPRNCILPPDIIPLVRKKEFAIGSVPLTTMEGNIFRDADANGVKSGSEGNLQGWDVVLRRTRQDYKQDNLADTRQLKTDASGNYKFYVWPGEYVVSEVVTFGYEPTSVRKRFTDNGLLDTGNTGVLTKASWTAIADLNNDGRNDIIVANDYSDMVNKDKPSNIEIYYAQSGNNYLRNEIKLGDRSRPQQVLVADLNGDGKPEIIVATIGDPQGNQRTNPLNSAYGEVIIFTNNGNTSNGTVNFSPSSQSKILKGEAYQYIQNTIGGNGPRHISIGYLNGDLVPDLVITNQRTYDPLTNKSVANPARVEDISIAYGENTGGKNTNLIFMKSQFLNYSTQTLAAEVQSTAIGDFNSDGYNDIAVALGRLGRVDVLYGGGSSSTNANRFSTTNNKLSRALGRPIQVTAKDIVGSDGKVDLIVSDYANNQILVFQQQPVAGGKGLLATTSIATKTMARPTWFDVGDLDKNGLDDLAVVTAANGQVQQLIGISGGRFTPSTPQLNVIANRSDNKPAVMQQVAIGKLDDGDTYSDLVITHFTGGISVHPSAVIPYSKLSAAFPAGQSASIKGVPLNDVTPGIASAPNPTAAVIPYALPLPLVKALPAGGLPNGQRIPIEKFVTEGKISRINTSFGNLQVTTVLPLALKSNSSSQDSLGMAYLDVSQDGQVSPLDALLVINWLNVNSADSTSEFSVPLDTSGDGAISPLDALLVINQLNLSDVDTSKSIEMEQVQTILNAGIDRYVLAGLDATTANELRQTTIRIANLPGDSLAWIENGTLVIDSNAAGKGWFIDSTPMDDEEFNTDGFSSGRDEVDLLSVLAHELGHLLGLDEEFADDDDIMFNSIASGLRRLSASAIDEVLKRIDL